MPRRFTIDSKSNLFQDLDDIQVIFHGINKSGSWAMAKVIGEGLKYAGRSEEYLCHYGSDWSLDEFRKLVDNTDGRGFAVAHQLYGTLKPARRRIWVTQFRHPLPRVLSVYSWLKNKHVRQHGSEDGFPNFQEFVRRGRGVSHSQVKQFGCGYGKYGAKLSKRLSAKDLYEISVDTLEREIYVIGIAELFEQSIFTFAALCGIESVSAWATDVRNKNRPLINEISSSDQDLIREFFEWDFQLYEYALERFHKQANHIQFGSSLEAYQDACKGQYKDRLIS